MKKRTRTVRARKAKEIPAGGISKAAIALLLLLVIVISIIGTWTVLEAAGISEAQQPGSETRNAEGNIELTILPQQKMSDTGTVTLTLLPPEK